jgi:hypothetical protein
MKYTDLVSIGVASGAYLEASRAHAGVNQLSDDIDQLRKDVESQKSEREFQKWVEELIYQFEKSVTSISNSPADPIHDYTDIASFLFLIKNKGLETSRISGLEKKTAFEKTLAKALSILTKLEEIPEVQDYFHKQQEEAREKERWREEKDKLRRVEQDRKARVENAKRDDVFLKRTRKVMTVFWIFFIFIIFSFFINTVLFVGSLGGFLIFVGYFHEEVKEWSRFMKFPQEKRKQIKDQVKKDAEDKSQHLLDASYNGNFPEVKRLLNEGKVDINVRDNGHTALMLACRNNNPEVVKSLLAAGFDINAKDYEGDTALVKASFYGHLEVVKSLLDAGADVNARDEDGNTALKVASIKNHHEVVNLLKAHVETKL